jgi:hypothetical protein
MSRESAILTPEERDELELTALVRRQLEEQFENLEQQHEVASLGMWVFLATEVMFFGALFLSLGVYRYLYPEAFERASEKLNWIIGGINTVVLLVSSLTMVLAVSLFGLGFGILGFVVAFFSTGTSLRGNLFGIGVSLLALAVNLAIAYAPVGYLPPPTVPKPWQTSPDRTFVPPPAVLQLAPSASEPGTPAGAALAPGNQSRKHETRKHE